MNLELIKKYLPEFNSYVKGQPLTLGYKTHWGTYEWTDLVWADWDSSINEHIIIINDEYLPYRKALAEGKTVERNYFSGIDNPNSWEPMREDFTGAPRFYRIKPEEPKFKVGDWVRQGTRVFQYSYTDLQYDKANPTHCQNDEKWEPREGETCIFWDTRGSHTIIDTFRHKTNNKYHTENSFWNYCMPFTGTLPPHMKDSK